MFKLILFTVVVLVGIAAALPVKEKPLTNSLKLKWKSEIGRTTDRTRPVLSNGAIWIGSNGSHLMDYAIDYGNGIYRLNARTGKVEKHFLNEKIGDMDVNGILMVDDRFIAGSDNEELTCFDKNGKVSWRIPTGGDVEHRPVLVRSGERKMVIFATENGQVSAVQPEDGKLIWNYFHPQYAGWKPGENRFVFKVNNQFYAGNYFFTEPTVADINKDGTDDLIYNSNYSDLMAFDGRTGKVLWKFLLYENGIGNSVLGKNSPAISTVKNESICWVPLRKGDNAYMLVGLNHKGEVKFKKPLGNGQLYLSQNSPNGRLELDNATIDLAGDMKMVFSDKNEMVPYFGTTYLSYANGRVADNQVKMNGETCSIISFEFYQSGTDRKSLLVIRGQKTGKEYVHQILPAISEFIPVVQDVDADGKIDVLTGCFDGSLYCYSLGIDVKYLVKP